MLVAPSDLVSAAEPCLLNPQKRVVRQAEALPNPNADRLQTPYSARHSLSTLRREIDGDLEHLVGHTAKNTRSPVQLPCGAPAACRVLLVLRRRPHHPRAWLLRLRPLPRPRPVCGCTAAAPALICEPAAGLPPSARSRQLVPAGGKPPPRINSPVAAPVAPNLPDDHNLTRFVFGREMGTEEKRSQ